ncbi:MAG: hypothetical protein WBN57_06190 [Gammaproteobacteria bacterium]
MRRPFCLAVLLATAITAQAGEWSGYVAGEFLGFVEDPAFPSQHRSYFSISAEPEYIHEWNDRDDLFTFKPYALLDQYDSRRSHADIRELSWVHAARDWELLTGISKVYWGVMEAAHLVDIINQTDQVVNIDGEDKLGQPMLNLSLIRDWGVVDLFLLPGFRERTCPSKDGRPRFALPIDNDVIYESGAENLHTDVAVRWSHTLGEFDVGLAHFYGTSREPRFLVRPAAINPLTLAISEITPVYEIINQTSIDLQAIYGSWLLKLEALTRSGQGKRVNSAAAGFEYTFVGVRDSALDVGIIAEYLYDSRGDGIEPAAVLSGRPFSLSPFQNDLALGARLTLNDAMSSELLASVIIDLDGGGESYNIEASRRYGDSWKLSLEARGVSGAPDNTTQASFSDDARLRTELAWYF